MSGTEPEQDATHVIQWLRVPAALYLENLRRLDDLVHELRIVRAGAENEDGGSSRLANSAMGPIIDDILGAYPETRDEGEHQAQRAVEDGDEFVDITIHVPPGAADHANRLIGLLEAADELCRSEQLLTLAATPEIAHLRRWACDQLDRQLTGGEEPKPYRPAE